MSINAKLALFVGACFALFAGIYAYKQHDCVQTCVGNGLSPVDAVKACDHW